MNVKSRFVILGVLLTAPAQAEVGLVLPGNLPGEAWVEVTPISPAGASRAFFPKTGGPMLLEGLRPGLAMVCRGGEDVAVTCGTMRLEEGELPFEFARGRAVVGRYASGDEPCAEAEVRIVPVPLPLDSAFALPLVKEVKTLRRHLRTDEDGRFVTPALAAGAYLLEAVTAEGVVHRSEPFTVPPVLQQDPQDRQAAVAPVDLGTLQVDIGLQVEFLVLDLDGQPVSGALVGGGQGDRPSELREFTGTTGEDGRVTVAGWLPDTAARTVCRAEGFEAESQTFDLPPPLVLCAMKRLGRIFGLVESEDGEPVTNALLGLRTEYRNLKAHTDETGRFELPELAAGSHELRLTASGAGALRLVVDLESGENRDLGVLVLPAGEDLRGQIIDAASGEGIENARVQILKPESGDFTTTDQEGRFALRTERGETVELLVHAEGYADHARSVPSSEEIGAEEVEIALSPGGFVRVLVEREAGVPCVRCRVVLAPAPPDDRMLMTNENGEAISRPLQPGRYSLALNRTVNRGSMLIVEGGRQIEQTEVRPGETVTVRFGPAEQSARLVFSGPLPPGAYVLTRGGHEGRVDSSPDGAFEIPLSSRAPTVVFLASDTPTFQTRQGVLILEDAGDTVSIRLGDAALSGTLRRADQPVRDAIVRVRSNGTLMATARSASDGSFSLIFLSPGTYDLEVDGHAMMPFRLDRREHQDLGSLSLP